MCVRTITTQTTTASLIWGSEDNHPTQDPTMRQILTVSLSIWPLLRDKSWVNSTLCWPRCRTSAIVEQKPETDQCLLLTEFHDCVETTMFNIPWSCLLLKSWCAGLCNVSKWCNWEYWPVGGAGWMLIGAGLTMGNTVVCTGWMMIVLAWRGAGAWVRGTAAINGFGWMETFGPICSGLLTGWACLACGEGERESTFLCRSRRKLCHCQDGAAQFFLT